MKIISFHKGMLCNVVLFYNYFHNISVSYDSYIYNGESGKLKEKPIVLKIVLYNILDLVVP